MQHTTTECRKPPVNGREQPKDRETRPPPTGVASQAISDGAHHSGRVPEQPVDRLPTPRTQSQHPPPNPTHPNSDNTPSPFTQHPYPNHFPTINLIVQNYICFLQHMSCIVEPLTTQGPRSTDPGISIKSRHLEEIQGYYVDGIIGQHQNRRNQRRSCRGHLPPSIGRVQLKA